MTPAAMRIPDDQALELGEENLERADGLAFLQFVQAVGREPLRCFVRRESFRSGSKLCQHLLSGLAVPDFAFWLFATPGAGIMRWLLHSPAPPLAGPSSRALFSLRATPSAQSSVLRPCG